MLDKIKEEIKTAMKSGDKVKLGTLRMLLSDLKNLQIEKGGINTELSEDDIITVVQRNVKKRNEAAKSYRDAGREETALQEEAEAAVLAEYLPEMLSEEELEKAVDDAIAQTGASSKREMGKVMGMIMGKFKGKVDGKAVQTLVNSKLP